MKFDLSKARAHLADHQLDFFGGSPVVIHCHHFNLFWDQTMDDALGMERGIEVRTQAAHKASHALLRGLVDSFDKSTPIERLGVAAAIFSAMGHGKLHLAVGRSGGLVRGDYLHYGFGWREKYGATLRRSAAADAFAAGFSAAATEVAYDLAPGSLRALEERCIVDGSTGCEIRVSAGDGGLETGGVGFEAAKRSLPATFDGLHEERIVPIVAGLRDFLGGVAGDERGVIEAFGVLVTQHLADYYNHCANDTMAIAVSEKPHVVDVFRALLRESGQVCAFHTFGGVLASPEWEAMVGAPSGDSLEIVLGCLAQARALGFGKWGVEEYVPGSRMVLSSPGTYETIFGRVRAPDAPAGVAGFFPGAAVGIMQLAHEVEWQPRPNIDGPLYLRLARQNTWSVVETSNIASGAGMDRVVVTRT